MAGHRERIKDDLNIVVPPGSLFANYLTSKMAINAALKKVLHQAITSISNYGLTVHETSDCS